MVELPGEDERELQEEEPDLVPLPDEAAEDAARNGRPDAERRAQTSAAEEPAGLFHRYRLAAVWLPVLWAVGAGWLIAGGWAAIQDVRQTARRQAMLVVPQGLPGETERAALTEELSANEAVAGVRWIPPQQVAELSARRIPREAWADLFQEEEVWLPWIAEVTFEEMPRSSQDIDALSESLQADARVELALWDAEGMARLAREGQRRWLALAILGGIWLLLGLIALGSGRRRGRDSPGAGPRAGIAGPVADGVLAAAVIGLTGAVLALAGWPIGWAAGLAGTAAGFALATFVAPVLQGHRF